MISRARGRFVFGALAALLWAVPAAAANQAPIANAGPDKSGVAGGTITFDGSGSRDPDGTVAVYWWQFGDGSSASVGTPTVGHRYASAGTYSATLWVKDAAGAWSATSDIVRATIATGTVPTTTTTTYPFTTTTLSTNKLPIADAGPNQATQTLITLTFNGSGSRDPDGSIVMAGWNFGDGTTGSGLTTTHAYAHAGTYTATLTISDNRGAADTDTATITVANRSPVASAGADVSGSTGTAVTLNGAGSSDPDGSISSYAWTFGDGTSGSGASVGHTYAAVGTYTATLRVTDNNGASASDTAVATIVVTGGGGATWSKKIGGSGSDGAYAIGTDAAGNVFVGGNFRSNANLGTATLSSAGGADGYIVKYSPAGAVLWAKSLGGSADDTVEGLAVDKNGDVVIGGRFTGTVNFGGGALVANGTSDMVVAKFAGASGAHVWSRRYGGAYDDSASAVAVDGGNNVYFTGYFRGTANFGGGNVSVPYTSDLDTFLVKLTSGGQYVWGKTFTNTGNERGYGIAVDAAGSAVITGSFSNAMTFGGAQITALNAMTDGFVARFTSTGAHQWSRRFGANDGNEGSYGVALDPSGNVLVTGAVVKSCDFGGGLLSALGSSDAFVAKYSASSGAHMWSRRLGGTGNDYGYGVAADASSNVYVSGAIGGVASFGGLNLTPLGSSDAFVAKYGPTGTLLSVRGLGGLDAETGRGVALSGANPVTIGYFYGAGVFAGTSLTSSGMADGFVTRLAP